MLLKTKEALLNDISNGTVPQAFVNSGRYFETLFQEYVYISRYSRFIHDLGRRESWSETVARYFEFFTAHLKERCGYELSSVLRNELEQAVLNLEVMPSMRCLMSAGPALVRDEMAGFNCSYATVDNPKVFAEILYILMVGTGVGFSVERQHVNKLPEVPEELYPTDTTIVISDSKIGWAKGLNELVSILYTGYIPKVDYSRVRPAGSVLKTFGGRASGPEPLKRCLDYIVSTFKEAKGRKLTSLECHDIVCMIGECVVSGGVRRSATISLSNLSDDRMRSAKSGQWWNTTPWRSLANNSAVYNDRRPTMDVFMSEWFSLFASKSGERGIFSRFASRNVIERSNAFRKEFCSDIEGVRERPLDYEWGCNPCSEIILRPNEVCNLTEIVVREDDTLETLLRKARIASILGTFQATLTHYRFLSKKWQTNAEDERLLGVSLTGIMDNPVLAGENVEKLKDWLTQMRREVIKTNVEMASDLNIPSSTASTCIKPSGTVSSLVDSSAGIHGRHSDYYLRTIRSDKKDPCAQVMIDAGVPYEDDIMRPDHNMVFTFPMKSPQSSKKRENATAIDQLNFWLLYQMYWCDHKPSVTISVRDDEWMAVGAWVYAHFEYMSGVSFLPFVDHIYQQAPYQEVAEKEYHEWQAKMPQIIDWSTLTKYESNDLTIGSQNFACVSKEGCDL